MAINPEVRYKFITRQLEYTNEKIMQSFGMFIKLTTVIFGGVIWLKTQNLQTDLLKTLVFPIKMILLLVGIGSISLIIQNLQSWWGFRKAESSLISEAPPPKHLASYIDELIMICIIIIAIIMGWIYLGKIII